MSKNGNLHQARKKKNNEFYTMYEDIEKELVNYIDFLKDKVVYCNCDDYRMSNFVKYFKDNFKTLGLKKLISTNYNNGTGAYKFEYNGEVGVISILLGDGDFRSDECIAFLKEADVVVTNPPFSLFREYVAQLMEYEKKFLIIGNNNAITFKEIFPLIKDNKLLLGVTRQGTGSMWFEIPKDFPKKVGQKEENGIRYQTIGNSSWFTNIEYNKRHQPIDLYRRYNPEDYPKYDNYDAINVDKVSEIPIDYDGVMGVPITFLGKYCPEQFEIVSFRKGEDGKNLVFTKDGKIVQPYFRILIKQKK